MANFNPRSREGSDCPCRCSGCTFRYFNPRSREGSDWKRKSTVHTASEFQSTLPRRERRPDPFEDVWEEIISIHAPAKGATKTFWCFIPIFANFNPRSREGSDISEIGGFNYRSDFNPRSREGSDGLTLAQMPAEIDISIHAPAKGATLRIWGCAV